MKYSKNDTHVILPSEIDEQPLTVIGTKAFLSCRQVEKLILPETLEQVEDWALAHMKGLQEISFPAKEILFGKYLVEKVPSQVLEMMRDTDSEFANDVKYFQIWRRVGGLNCIPLNFCWNSWKTEIRK